MINVFNLILQLKNIKKERLVIDETDERIMKLYYKDVKDIITYSTWRKIVIDYTITTMKDLIESCEDLSYEIVNKYKNNK